MAWARAHPVAYPMAHPKFCDFINYKENNNCLRARGSGVVNSSDSRHFFHETRPQGVLPVIGGLMPWLRPWPSPGVVYIHENKRIVEMILPSS